MVRLASEGLRSVGATSPSKSACSILPLARRWRAGETFRVLTPARGSLLKPAAGKGFRAPAPFFRAALRSYTYNTGNTAARCLPDGHGEGR